MNQKIFAYCERGQDPGFWAEPLNAVTNEVLLTMRTLDRVVCDQSAYATGDPLGLHFMRHVLNATLLFVLVRAALKHRRTSSPVLPLSDQPASLPLLLCKRVPLSLRMAGYRVWKKNRRRQTRVQDRYISPGHCCRACKGRRLQK